MAWCLTNIKNLILDFEIKESTFEIKESKPGCAFFYFMLIYLTKIKKRMLLRQH
jgi:hypothetical protein